MYRPSRNVRTRIKPSEDNPANLPVYTVIGVWFRGEADPTLLASKDRIIVFDTPQLARDFLPRLGGGRPTLWSGADEAFWPVLNPMGINRAVVLWNYDPYDAPHARSESRIREWRNHVMWMHALTNTEQLLDETRSGVGSSSEKRSVVRGRVSVRR